MNLLQNLSTTSEGTQASEQAVSALEKNAELMKEMTSDMSVDKMQNMIERCLDWSVDAGKNILMALIVFVIGHYFIKFVNKMFVKMMEKRKLDPSIKSFLKSLVNIILKTLLIISIVSTLGLDTTSFAALLASAGLAVGMALSGNLQNFAGGIIILFFKPFKVGDYIEAQGNIGLVQEIQIFHTIIKTDDNKVVFIPNGALSSGNVVNYNANEVRRLQWNVCIDYGEDIDKVRKVLLDILNKDSLILQHPAPVVYLGELAANSVDLYVRVWVQSDNYWKVFYDNYEKIYNTFNAQGINFPYPQLTVHNG